MTLSLDDVRNKRFRMARKSGYEVLEVDEFVDEVEATFEQLFEENQNLKKQVESGRIREEASSSAERLESEARSQAERLQADAQGRSQALDRELETRRTEMFGNLEKQREQLTATVNALRAFEATYRSNLTTHLKSQIDVL